MIEEKYLRSAEIAIKNKIIDVVKVEALVNKEFGPELWTVDKLIPQQSITAITGTPESYKTWLALDIAKNFSRGSHFLGEFKTEKGNVLIIDKENHARHIQKRLKMMEIEKEEIFYMTNIDDLLIDNEKYYREILDIVQKLNIKLIIFDSLIRMHSGDENDARQISKVMGLFRKLTNKGATVIFIHHNRKESPKTVSTTNSMRGSSDILAGLDCLLQVDKISNDCLKITQSKLRQDRAVAPFIVKIELSDDAKNIKFLFDGENNSLGKNQDDVKNNILNLLSDNTKKSRQEIIDELSSVYKIQIITLALRELETNNQIIKEIGASNKHTYSINSQSHT